MNTTAFNYDPNHALLAFGNSPKKPIHTVRVTLGLWNYRATVDVEIGGNCLGWDILNTAVDAALDKVMADKDFVEVVLTDPASGETLDVDLAYKYPDGEKPERGEGAEAEFQRMVLGVEILNYTLREPSTK